MSIQQEQIQSENPDLDKKMSWMKERLGLETDEELFSKALSFLNQAIELEDRGFTLGGWRQEGMLDDREVITYRICPEK